jgi:hypothetical protein
VESKTENTEEDVTEEMKSGSLSLGFPRNEPFAFPGLRNDMEALEKDFFGSLGNFLDLLVFHLFTTANQVHFKDSLQRGILRKIPQGRLRRVTTQNSGARFQMCKQL